MNLHAEILKHLLVAPGPQTAVELCDSLRHRGLKVEEFQLLERLRRLQRDGFVRLEGIRWRLLKMPADGNLARGPQPKVSAPLIEVAPQVVSLGQNAEHIPRESPLQPTGRWAFFRRLCRYYMDYLLQDEAPKLRAYVDNEDDTWIAVHDVPWARLAAGGSFAVSLTREQAPFQRNRVRRGEDDCVYLG